MQINGFESISNERYNQKRYRERHGGTFGTWQTLHYYRANASDNGNFHLTKSIDSCLSIRQNWLLMIEEMKSLYFKSGLYKQSFDGDLLLQSLGQ